MAGLRRGAAASAAGGTSPGMTAWGSKEHQTPNLAPTAPGEPRPPRQAPHQRRAGGTTARDIHNGVIEPQATPEDGEHPNQGDERRVRLQRIGPWLLVEDNKDAVAAT